MDVSDTNSNLDIQQNPKEPASPEKGGRTSANIEVSDAGVEVYISSYLCLPTSWAYCLRNTAIWSGQVHPAIVLLESPRGFTLALLLVMP